MSESKKHILLAITGMSPQVVTETLYAIHQKKLPWPSEIQIITTKKGKRQAELGLLKIATGKDHSMLTQLCLDYELSVPDVKIEVIPNAEGWEVDDARTKEDQDALADFIVKKVASLCQNENIQIHASLAGGRKTMTFYLGYAMTLFARQGDRLSHVLISPDNYEGLPEFYYPTPYSQPIKGRRDNELLDSSSDEVTIELAEIPFIRQRNHLKKSVLMQFTQQTENEQLSYRQLVELQNLASHDIELFFNLPAKLVTLKTKDKNEIIIDFSKNIRELAFYSMIARSSNPDSQIHIERNPEELNKEYAILYMKEIDSIAGNEIAIGKNITIKYEDRLELAKDYQLVNPRTIEGFKNGMDVQFLDDCKNALKKFLQMQFPEDFTDMLIPSPTKIMMNKVQSKVKYIKMKVKTNLM